MNVKLGIILLLSVIVGVYAAEIYTQYGYGLAPGTTAEDADDRSAIEAASDLRVAGTQAYPYLFFRGHQIVTGADGQARSIFSDAGDEFAPLGFIANATTVLCNEIGKWQIYDSDEHGFNNPRGLWGNTSIDVLALGDSFTHGSCVDPEDHMVSRIRSKHPLTLNLGRLGTGPLFQLAALKEYGPATRPKVVVWFVLEDNDIDGDLHDEQKIPLLRKYLQGSFRQNLLERQQTIDTFLKDYVNKNFSSWLETARQRRSRGLSGPAWVETSPAATNTLSNPEPGLLSSFLAIDWDKVVNTLKLQNTRNTLGISGIRGRKKQRLEVLYQAFEQILMEAKRVVQTWDGNLQIVYLAGPTRYNSWRQKNVRDYQRQNLMAVFDRQRVPVIDVISLFEDEPNPRSLFYGHYSPKGYKIVADAVLLEIDRILQK